jgi:hypothetical protein
VSVVGVTAMATDLSGLGLILLICEKAWDRPCMDHHPGQRDGARAGKLACRRDMT